MTGGPVESRGAREPDPVPPLGRAAGVAVRWNGVAALVTLGSQLAQVVFLARWLLPSEYGLAASALAVTAFLAGLCDLGLAGALVQREEVSSRAWAGAWWGATLTGACLGVVLVASASRLGAALRLDGLAPLLAVAAFALPLAGPAAVFQAHLQRQLRLRRLAVVEIAASLAALAVTLALAWYHRSPLALVAGQVALAAFRFAGLGLASSLRPAPRARWADVRPLAAFGGYQLGERVVAQAYGNADRLLVAALLGPAAAGHYFMASQIALKPASLIGPFVGRTLLPLLARIRGDVARTASSYLRALSLLALLAFFVYALLFGLADPVVALLLGSGWEDVVVPLRILAVAGVLVVLGNALGSLTLALGRAGTSFWVTSAVFAGSLLAIFAGARFGLVGVAAASLAVIVLSLPVDFLLPRLWLGISPSRLARSIGWPLLPAVLGAGVMLLLVARLPFSSVPVLGIAGVTGALLFLGAVRLLHRERLRAAFREIADKVGGRGA